MKPLRGWAGASVLGLAAVMVVVAALALAGIEGLSGSLNRTEHDRPALMLVTSLPLAFSEEFSLEAGSSRAFDRLDEHYRVLPIGTTDERSLRQANLLLMAHPLAQPAEDLVALDGWVRSGGRLLLLADPMLEWPSIRPLGDRLRPPPGFADTGLLAHWGLGLSPPAKRGAAWRELGDRRVLARSPGVIEGACDIGPGGFYARCRIGRGRVTIVADADFINAETLGADGEANLDALISELDALEG